MCTRVLHPSYGVKREERAERKRRGGAFVSFCAVSPRISCSPDGAERNPGTMVRLHCRSRITLRFIRATNCKKKGSGTPTDASSNRSALLARQRVPAHALACRRPTAVSPQGVLVPKAQRQAMFPGTRPKRALPAVPVPVQGSTPRPGRNAGGHDARAAREHGVWPRPQGRTRSAFRGYLRERRP